MPLASPVDSKRVAVIGAGPSGLVAVKELLAEGHRPVCFERAAGIGGVFRFDEEHGVVWESCRLTSSGLLTAFSDFPVPPDRIGHMTTGEYVDYLGRYCEAFDLARHIRFGTAAQSVERDGAGWRVVTADGEERFDAVAVCSGLHQSPHRPQFDGEETFSGEILHGAEYRRPAQAAGKRVLIVGAGESGADVVAEVAAHATETVLSLRRGVSVLPRLIRGYPNDYLTSRLNNSAAHWIYETRNPADAGKLNVYRVAFLPLVVVDKCIQTFFRALAAATTRPRLARETKRLTRQLLAESGGTRQEQFGTKSDEFVKAIAAGRCRRAGPVARFDGDRAVFADGSTFEPDLVILCTGFDVKLPFLGEALGEAPRYLLTFVPSVGAGLAFVGLVRPSFGAIPPLAELQARWFALLLSGAVDLPPEDEMRASVERLADFRAHYFRAVRGRLDYLVDYTSLSDELASKIGCKPTREALGRESRRFRRRFVSAPFVAAQYRLVGPHAEPALARQVIESLPIAHPAHERALFHLRARLSRLLWLLLGPRFAPKLELSRR